MKGSAEHSVERRRDAFNASNGGRLRGRPLFFVAACPLGIKSRVQLSPRNPANAFTVYVAVAGLSPSRSDSVLAQLFS